MRFSVPILFGPKSSRNRISGDIFDIRQIFGKVVSLAGFDEKKYFVTKKSSEDVPRGNHLECILIDDHGKECAFDPDQRKICK